MRSVLVAGVDPGFRAFAVARMRLDLDTLELSVEDLLLETTANEAKKGMAIRKNSDDLRRALELREFFHKAVDGCAVAFAEIPSGAQDANAAKGFGICIGLLAGCPIPVLQVQVADAKKAAVGTRTASKDEMIEWAMETFPKAPWMTRKFKGNIVPVAANEHIADACAIATAGVGLQEFRQLLSMWKATALAA